MASLDAELADGQLSAALNQRANAMIGPDGRAQGKSAFAGAEAPRDIGWAVCEMRYHGGKVRRRGWNGRGMYLVFQKGYPDGVPLNANTAQATGIPQGTVCRFDPYVMMYTAAGTFVPWLCSQSDLLAQDWELVNG